MDNYRPSPAWPRMDRVSRAAEVRREGPEGPHLLDTIDIKALALAA